ncbi:MAG: hypothetical protein ABL857_01495 [Rickettsiales bacterium]|jgi:hypothetical protein
MRVFKLGFIVTCACFVAMPALAQNSSSSVTETPAAIKVMDKEAYIKNINQSFESMDHNKDGVVSLEEISSSGDYSWIEDERAFRASVGVPVKKAKADKKTNNTSVGVPPINADQIQK